MEIHIANNGVVKERHAHSMTVEVPETGHALSKMKMLFGYITLLAVGWQKR